MRLQSTRRRRHDPGYPYVVAGSGRQGLVGVDRQQVKPLRWSRCSPAWWAWNTHAPPLSVGNYHVALLMLGVWYGLVSLGHTHAWAAHAWIGKAYEFKWFLTWPSENHANLHGFWHDHQKNMRIYLVFDMIIRKACEFTWFLTWSSENHVNLHGFWHDQPKYVFFLVFDMIIDIVFDIYFCIYFWYIYIYVYIFIF